MRQLPLSIRSLKLTVVILMTGLGLVVSSIVFTTPVRAQRDSTPRMTQASGDKPTVSRTKTVTTSSGQSGTATALAGRLTSAQSGGTATALAGKIAGTATAAANKVAASATAYVSKVAPTLTALAIKVNVTATLPANQAAAALASYASSVLGTTVSVTKAGGLTADITKSLTQTQESADAQTSAIKLATESYGGLLANGVAALSYGTGAVSGDINIDVQGTSLGVYSLALTTSTPLDALGALSLAQKTFPNLAGFAYTTYPVSKGYAWYTTSSVSAIDPKSHKVVMIAETVILYVLPGSNGKTATVSATVGRGDFAKLIEIPDK